MASNLGSLVVSLGLDAGQFIAGLTKSEYQAKKSMEAIRKEVQAAREQFERITGALATLSAGALTVTGIVDGIAAVKREAIASEQAVLQLNAALKGSGGGSGLTRADLDDLAKGIKEATTFSTEDIRKAETALLRFRDIRKEVFEQGLTATPDLAVALGTTLPEAAAKLGRALEDPSKGLRGLKEAGVALTETQIAMAIHFSEVGDKAKAQKIVLDAVTASTSGAALAATLGLSGATDKLARSFTDLESAAGRKLFGENHTLAERLSGIFDGLAQKIDKSTGSLTAFLAKAAIATFGGPAGLLGVFANEAGQGIGGALVPSTQAQRTSTGKIGGIDPGQLTPEQEEARSKALEEDIKRRIDALTTLQFDQLKSLAEHSAQFYGRQAADQKNALDIEQSNLEFAYGQGLVSSDVYFSQLKRMALRNSDEQIGVLFERQQIERNILASNLSTEADRAGARSRLLGIEVQADTIRFAQQQRVNTLTQQEIVAIQKLKDEYADLGAGVAESQGRLADAAVARFDIANRVRRQQLEAQAGSSDPVTSALGQFGIDALESDRKLIDSRGKLTEATKSYEIVIGDLGIEQAQIDLLVQTGAASEIQAYGLKSEVARRYIELLKQQADAQEVAASGLSGPEREAALLNVRKLRLEIAQLDVVAEGLKHRFDDIVTTGLGTFFEDVIGGTKSIKNAFFDMTKGISQSINKLVSEDLAKRLYKSIFGGADSASGFDLGALLSKLIGGAGGGSSAGFGDFPTGFGDIPAFAGGTNYAGGGMALVGESGPEIVNLPRGAQVIPNNQLQPAMNGGRSLTVHQTINVLPGATRESATQAANAMGTELALAEQRHR